jgi:hypothetical protein
MLFSGSPFGEGIAPLSRRDHLATANEDVTGAIGRRVGWPVLAWILPRNAGLDRDPVRFGESHGTWFRTAGEPVRAPYANFNRVARRGQRGTEGYHASTESSCLTY